MSLYSLVSRAGQVARQAARRLEASHLRRPPNRRPYRGLVLGGGLLSASVAKEGLRAEEAASYDWESKLPGPGELARYFGEVDEAHRLARETLTCSQCGDRLRIEGELEDVVYCKCPDAPKSVYGVEGPDGWRPFVERRDILVWRRPHPTLQGMYEYKMYGNFGDVTAEEFLAVQNDLTKFRASWDASTKQLGSLAEEGSSVVYHWEVNWPRFFSNREYCCHRTVQTDPSTGTVACINTSTEHPGCRGSRGTVRVTDYRSVLTVRPHTSPTSPGTEFCLTGFEDSGIQLPETIVTWVAVRGMPEFMVGLRAACLRLRREREERGGSWGRQEDNFGQLHQFRHQQRQYA